jgi:hypothetical protein
MRRPASQALVRHRLRKAELRWSRSALAGLPDDDALAQLQIEPETDAEELAAGSRPQRFFRDRAGRRYLFKTAPADHVAAEILVARFRALGGRPRLPVARRTLDLDDRGSTDGMIQPVIEHAGERLALETSEWSPLQVEAMLDEHPWEWVVGNFDTHVDQYVLVGPERLPFNIDWDHALMDLEGDAPTRHDRRSAAVFPLRNLLYGDYVAGELSLDFWGMALQARAVSRIPDAALEKLLDRHVADLEAGGVTWSEEELARVRTAVLARKRSCGRVFDAFIDDVRRERAASLRSGPNPHGPARRLASAARDAWQRFAIRIGHDRIVRPVLRVQRDVLDAWDRVRRRVG